MRTADWAVDAERVTVRLGKEDRANMETIRRAVLGERPSFRHGRVASQGLRLELSYADTLRLVLAREAARMVASAPVPEGSAAAGAA